MNVDIRILELLSSRMCHDLVSPVGAINNGVELIEEVGGNTTGDALQLIAKSAVQAARRLRCFRLAYGRAGSESGLSINDVRQVAEQYLEGGKSKIVWPASAPIAAYAEHRGAMKLLLNTIMLAEEILAYGGIIQIDGEAGSPQATISISGRAAHVPDHLTAAVADTLAVDDITSKTVHAYLTARLAEYYGFAIKADVVGEEAVNITLSYR
jgi:histidine phosphotransferase ChpT